MSDIQNENGASLGAGLEGTTGASSGRRRGRVDGAIDKAETVVGRAFGEPAAQKVGKTARSAVDSAEQMYERAFATVESRVARDPLKALAIAAGAGLVLGLMLGGRNRTIIYRPTHDHH